MWEKICLRYYDEETSGNPHWREALQLQSVWEAVHAERKSSGESYILIEFM